MLTDIEQGITTKHRFADVDLHAFGSNDAACRCALRFKMFFIFNLDFIQLTICSVRIVVKHYQSTDLGIDCQLPDLGY